MSKRHAEDNDEEQNKKIKFEHLPNDIVDSMEKYMKQAIKAFGNIPELEIPDVVYEIPRKLLQGNVSGSKVSVDLESFKTYCYALLEEVSAEKLGGKAKGKLLRGLVAAQLALEKLPELADELKDLLFTKSTPSTWAQRSVWSVEQSNPEPILCLRPTKKSGLPLTLLHSIFSRFRQLRRQPLPRSQMGIDALRVAFGLCSSMGDGFESKESRGSEFDKFVGNFLPGYKATSQIVGRKDYATADRIIELDGRCIIIREDKNEMGSGDAYMQVSRAFDMACENMKSNRIMPDAPVFLLCVMGPCLTISGGFKDHADTVVEPLCPGLLMLQDMDVMEGRPMQLAMHLFALRICMEELRGLPNPSSPASGLPRVLQSFQDAQGETRKLIFQWRLSETLVFAAVDDTSRHLCVKIIYGPYGEQVHRVLASEKMAPELFDVSRIEHGPTMIVMERLDNSWMTLHDFAQKNSRWIVGGVKSAIRGRLESILGKLGEHGLVHGDFRANNIMVKQNDEDSAMIIDFDWAGKAGEVCYPLDRNDGIWWPAEAGSAIHLAHDRDMLIIEWSTLQTS